MRDNHRALRAELQIVNQEIVEAWQEGIQEEFWDSWDYEDDYYYFSWEADQRVTPCGCHTEGRLREYVIYTELTADILPPSIVYKLDNTASLWGKETLYEDIARHCRSCSYCRRDVENIRAELSEPLFWDRDNADLIWGDMENEELQAAENASNADPNNHALWQAFQKRKAEIFKARRDRAEVTRKMQQHLKTPLFEER